MRFKVQMTLRSLGCWHVLLFGISLCAKAQSIERPDWSPGDVWHYRISSLPAYNRPGTFTYDGFVEVKARRSDRYDVIFGGYYGTQGSGANRVVRFSLDLNRVARAYSGGPLNETQWYRWPLHVNAKWDFPYHQPDGERVSIWEIKVEGWERVTVPAGTFDAVHLAGVRKTLTGSSGSAREDVWYAAEVKREVKHERYEATGGYTWNHWIAELTRYALH